MTKWFEKANEKLQKLLDLKENWDSYGAPRICPHAAVKADSILRWFIFQVPGLVCPNIVPTTVGGVELEWESGENYACVEFYSYASGHVTYLATVNDVEFEGSDNLEPVVEFLRSMSSTG